MTTHETPDRETEATPDALHDRPWEPLHDILETEDAELITDYVSALPAADAARAISHLTDHDRDTLLTSLEPESAAELIEELPEAQAAQLIENIEPEEAAGIVECLPSDEQADILNELEDDDAQAVLSHMDPLKAAELRTLSLYPPDVAGGLMVTELLSFPEQTRLSDIIEDVRGNADRYREFDVQYTYVTGDQGELLGVLPFRQLLLSGPDETAGNLATRNVLTVRTDTALEKLSDLLAHHRFYGLPVIDDEDRLVGVVRRADVEEAESERAERDHLKSQGIVGGEELRSMRLTLRSRRRLSWLSVNIVLNVIAASVIAAFEDTLAAVISLAVFLPIISDMSGCSGNQAVAVSMRELTLGLVKPVDALYVWVKELGVGLLNGVALGLLIGLTAYLWKGNVWLGLIVGAALCINTLVAVSIGGTIPLLLKRLGLDPALASGPVLTTITDLCGFALVLGLATMAMEHLVS